MRTIELVTEQLSDWKPVRDWDGTMYKIVLDGTELVRWATCTRTRPGLNIVELSQALRVELNHQQLQHGLTEAEIVEIMRLAEGTWI